jgi:hypothetical protein
MRSGHAAVPIASVGTVRARNTVTFRSQMRRRIGRTLRTRRTKRDCVSLGGQSRTIVIDDFEPGIATHFPTLASPAGGTSQQA